MFKSHLIFVTTALMLGSGLAAPLETTNTVKKTVLSNGLTILTKEIKGAPVVSVQVFYKIGSRNEAAGVNGIAHQLEHMLFKGTASRPVQFGRLFNALGAEFNAFTYYDQTAYYGTVEKEKAEALLELEADRMINAQIDPEKLAGERKVVLSEIEGNENDPSYRLERAVQQAAFPKSPYGLTVGGTRADIEGFSADKVSAYYKKYYSPEYATVVVVGDFETKPMLETVKKLFGKLGTPGTKPIVSSSGLQGNTNESTLVYIAPKAPIILKEAGATPLLNAVYPLPAIGSKDVAAIKVLDAILLSGRSSKLYQALFESGLAADGGTAPYHFLKGGWYSFNFTPAPDVTVQDLDKKLLETIAEVQKTPINDAEISRAKTQIIASTVLSNRSITAQATALGVDATTANDYRYTDRFLAALELVTAADVQRVAQKYLTPNKRTVGYFEPSEAAEGGDRVSAGGATTEAFNAGPPVDPAEVAKYLPAFKPSGAATVSLPQSIQLSNGMQIFLLQDRSTPTVSLSATVLAGREFDTDEKAGLVDLVGSNLLSGTKTRDELQLADLLDNVGASLSPSANRFGVSITGSSLSQDIGVLLEGFSDILQNSTFPEAKVKLFQNRALQGAKRDLDSPSSVAIKLFRKTIYPKGNPWQVFSTTQTLQALSQADLLKFYQDHYRPDTTILTLVGDFDPATVKAQLEGKFANWKAVGPTPSVVYPVVGKPAGLVRQNANMPGKTQSVTYLGYQSIDRKDPRYFATLVLNRVLGGDTLSSRLGTEIRDKQGLTYGISSSFAAFKQPGAFAISMQTSPKDTEKAVQATLSLLKSVRDQGISETEVSIAKKALVSGYTVGLANPEALAGTFTDNYSVGLPLSELTDFQAKVNAVTLEQVNNAAKELIDPENMVIITAGPEQK